jgi:hypothetical protein
LIADTIIFRNVSISTSSNPFSNAVTNTQVFLEARYSGLCVFLFTNYPPCIGLQMMGFETVRGNKSEALGSNACPRDQSWLSEQPVSPMKALDKLTNRNRNRPHILQRDLRSVSQCPAQADQEPASCCSQSSLPTCPRVNGKCCRQYVCLAPPIPKSV